VLLVSFSLTSPCGDSPQRSDAKTGLPSAVGGPIKVHLACSNRWPGRRNREFGQGSQGSTGGYVVAMAQGRVELLAEEGVYQIGLF